MSEDSIAFDSVLNLCQNGCVEPLDGGGIGR